MDSHDIYTSFIKMLFIICLDYIYLAVVYFSVVQIINCCSVYNEK